jgi:thymidylate kinase
LQELGIIRKLIDRLNTEGIVYCSWKSNEHIEEGLSGATDVDILVEKQSAVHVNRILDEVGYKRFTSTPYRSYPSIVDFLGFDESTGSLVHLHLHYELRIGEKHLKGFHMPWEKTVFSTRQFNEKYHIYVTDPHMEFLLLLIRIALKLRLRDRVFSLFGADFLDRNAYAEFRWLKRRLIHSRLQVIIVDTLGDEFSSLAGEMESYDLSVQQMIALRKRMKRTLAQYRIYTPIVARILRLFRECYWIIGELNIRYIKRPSPFKRVAPYGGVIVGFFGADGSGKTTLANHMSDWLSWKIDVFKIYFGSGDGPSSLIRLPLVWTYRFLRKYKLMKDGSYASSKKKPYKQGRLRQFRYMIKTIAQFVWAVILAYEKKKKLKQAWKARSLGMIVLCDRYPQCQVMGYADGPLLSDWVHHNSGIIRSIAQWELNIYKRADRQLPDIIIKLHVDAETASKRKKGMHANEISRRIEATKILQYDAQKTTIVDINSNTSLDEVILKGKKAIWDMI